MTARPEAGSTPAHGRGVTGAVLAGFFAVVGRWPGLVDRSMPLWLRLAENLRLARPMHRGLLANAARALGPGHPADGPRRLSRRILRHFTRFVIDIAANAGAERDELLGRVAWIRGTETYRCLRAGGRGVILATAHLGTFEVAMAALCARERVHVVYHHDVSGRFEDLRSRLRRRLEAHEAPIGGGLATWLSLRDALARDEAVLIQADRALPGQRAATVRFLGGHLRMPTGPLRLAQLSGAPVVPVFAWRLRDGRVGIELESGIEVGPGSAALDRAQQRLAAVIEAKIRARPQQWLMLHPALVEDA